MSSIRLDRVVFSTLHPAYQNHGTSTTNVTVSGSVPTGGKTFSVDIPLGRSGTRADIYYKNNTVAGKYTLNAGRIVQSTGTGRFTGYIKYAADTLTVGVAVENYGGAFTPSTQTYTFTIVQYDAPISS